MNETSKDFIWKFSEELVLFAFAKESISKSVERMLQVEN